MTSLPAGLRFGILAQGRTFSAWQARCIEELLRVPGVRASLLILPRLEPQASRWTAARPTNPLLLRAYSGLARPRAFKPVDMTGTFANVPSVDYSPRTREESHLVVEPSEVARIRSYDLDFLLHFASAVRPTELYDAARYGVWSFAFDDDALYREAAPGFWEIYHGDAVNGAVLRRLTGNEAGIVLRRGFFRTALHSLRRSIDEVHFGAAGWAANVCKDIVGGRTAYLEGPSSIPTGEVLGTPSNFDTMHLLARQTQHAIRRVGRGLFRHEEWCIGIVERPIASFLEPQDSTPVRWFRPPGKGRFIADPFGIKMDGAVRILYEDFLYRTSTGAIATFADSDPGPTNPPRVALELPVHASYPYVFVDRGEIFCVPETHEAREIGLYRAVDFPTRWEKAAAILRGPAALDGTVFRHEGRWWLTYTDLDAGQYEHLFVWHARDFEGPWEPHARNPVKSDVRSARPAGTPFVHDGTLYRPAQDCSRTYGGRITMNRIRRLTPDEFDEESVSVIEPFSNGPFPDGIHTISAVGDVTLIDGKRHRFIPSAIPYVIRNSR